MNFLCFDNWREIEVLEEKTHYIVRAKYEPVEAAKCTNCAGGSAIQRYGSRKRIVKDSPVRGKAVTVILSIQLYCCISCHKVFADEVPELAGSLRLTRRLIIYIVRLCLKKNYSEVGQECGVSESTVREIFTRFVESNQNLVPFNYPRVLGIDDVYIARTARCILTDIENKKVIEILPKRRIDVVYGFFDQVKGREDTEVVTMDMYRPFYSAVKTAFRHAKIVIDTFHVQRYGNQAISRFLDNVRKILSMSQRRLVLRDRFLLLKRNFNLSAVEKEKLKDWKSKWPELAEVYNLKEEFFTIWRLSKKDEAEARYQKWKKNMSSLTRRAFGEIITMIENWYEEIFNYFDHRYTNAFTESCNNAIKRMQSEGRGYDFETIRAKILFGYSIDLICEDETVIVPDTKNKTEFSRIERIRFTRESNVKYFPDWEE
jgi:transposase